MSVMPDGKLDKLQFCEEHIAPFTTNAVAIGTTAAAVTDLDTKTVAARAAYERQRAARLAAKDATVDFDLAIRAAADAASAIVKQVKAKAATAGDGVYSLASLPVPQPPAPLGPLGKPYQFVVRLSEGGALELSWKCTNPPGASGTIYQVSRRLGASEGPFAYVGATGTKTFVDATLPAGSSSVTYRVQAVRSTSVGPEAVCLVSFGVGPAAGAGAMVASIVEGSPAKLAA